VGRFFGALELGDTTDKKNRGEQFPKVPEMGFTAKKAGGIPKSDFLVDALEVVLLLGKNAEDEKTQQKHKYFIDLLKDASVTLPSLRGASSILENSVLLEQIRAEFEQMGAKPGDKVTFRIDSEYPVNSDAWHDWWREYFKGITISKPVGKKASKSNMMRCFVTGELVEPVATQPKINGLSDTGGLATGDTLASFKQDSFCSYGLVQAANSATSKEAAAAYRAALNHLIQETGQRLAGAKVIHWFDKKVPIEDDPFYFLAEPPEQEELNAQIVARQLLESIRSGKRVDLQRNHYYSMTLCGASGRVMVRDWMEGQFEELVQSVSAWFDDLAIVRRDGTSLAPAPKFVAVLGATVRDLKDLNAPFVAKMWRVALRAEPIPSSAMAQALNRVKIDIIQDSPFSHARMGLLKAYHIRKISNSGGLSMTEEMKPYLNEQHPSVAYQCGRLMAVLAALQRSALGDVGAGVVQRYYAAASTTPALVFGRLVRTSQFHLNKLEPGLAHWYEDRLANIWSRIRDSVPKTLTLEQQSLFALGYYQQLAAPKGKQNNIEKGATTNE